MNEGPPAGGHWKLVAKGVFGTAVIAGAIYAAAVYVPWWLAGPTRAMASPTQVYSVAFSLDGKRLVTGHHCCTGRDNRHVEKAMVRTWDAANGRLQATLAGHVGFVSQAVFAPDGKWVVSAEPQLGMIVWDAASGKIARRIEDGEAGVFSLAVSPDSKLVATGQGSVFELATGQQVAKFTHPCIANTENLTYSPDGKHIAVASAFDGLVICDAQTGQVIRKLGRVGLVGLYVTYFPDGLRVLAHGWFRDKDPSQWNREKRVPQLWDAHTGEALPVAGPQSPDRVAVSADGRWMVSVHPGGNIQVHEFDTGRLVHTRRLWKNEWANRLAISPDGKRIAVGGPDAIEIWDLP